MSTNKLAIKSLSRAKISATIIIDSLCLRGSTENPLPWKIYKKVHRVSFKKFNEEQ